MNESEYLGNGVKARKYEGGDAWAQAHRKELGAENYLTDIDGLLVESRYMGEVGEDRMFMEYVPDSWKNRDRLQRNFAVVALFDRKRSLDCFFSAKNRVSAAFYLYMARILSKNQATEVRFFVVCDEKDGWVMHEIGIHSGKVIWEGKKLHLGGWKAVWEEVGLMRDRRELEKSIQ